MEQMNQCQGTRAILTADTELFGVSDLSKTDLFGGRSEMLVPCYLGSSNFGRSVNSVDVKHLRKLLMFKCQCEN